VAERGGKPPRLGVVMEYGEATTTLGVGRVPALDAEFAAL
jgi:hypothetical protein